MDLDLRTLLLEDWARASQIWDGKDSTHINKTTVEGTLTPTRWAKAHHGQDIKEYRRVKSTLMEKWRILIQGTRTMDTMQQTAADLVNWTSQHNQQDYHTQMDELHTLVQNALPRSIK